MVDLSQSDGWIPICLGMVWPINPSLTCNLTDTSPQCHPTKAPPTSLSPFIIIIISFGNHYLLLLFVQLFYFLSHVSLLFLCFIYMYFLSRCFPNIYQFCLFHILNSNYKYPPKNSNYKSK